MKKLAPQFWVAAGGVSITFLGLVGPWVKAIGLVSISVSGFDSQDGKAMAVCALIAGILLALHAFKTELRWPLAAAGILGLLTAADAIYEVVHITRSVREMSSDMGSASTGWGIYACVLGGSVLAVGALLTILRSRRAQEPLPAATRAEDRTTVQAAHPLTTETHREDRTSVQAEQPTPRRSSAAVIVGVAVVASAAILAAGAIVTAHVLQANTSAAATSAPEPQAPTPVTQTVITTVAQAPTPVARANTPVTRAHTPPRTAFISCDRYVEALNPTTSCAFAENVFYQLYEAWPERSFLAYSPSSRVTYRMDCTVGGVGSVVTCTNDAGAEARFPWKAVQLYTPSAASAYASSHDLGPDPTQQIGD